MTNSNYLSYPAGPVDNSDKDPQWRAKDRAYAMTAWLVFSLILIVVGIGIGKGFELGWKFAAVWTVGGCYVSYRVRKSLLRQHAG